MLRICFESWCTKCFRKRLLFLQTFAWRGVSVVSGVMVQEKLTGQTAVEQLLSGHISPFNDGQGVF